MHKHPAVASTAVVAMPCEKWGEVPCAFVELHPQETLDEVTLLQFCRQHLASFKLPKRVVFETIEKTSTGKVQKFSLREKAKKLQNK